MGKARKVQTKGDSTAMTDLPSPCKYKCGTMLVGWDNDARAFEEEDGTLHSYERCIAIKNEKKAQGQGKITNTKESKEIAPSGKSDHYGEFEAKRQVILRGLEQLKKQVEGL